MMAAMSETGFDADRIRTEPLRSREHLIDIRETALDPMKSMISGDLREAIEGLADRLRDAKERGAARIMAYGAHVVKNGAGPLVNWLMEMGYITHLVTQGAGIIHDWEFAYLGQSSESVRAGAGVGRFGTWEETGRWINTAVVAGAAAGLGFGESMGQLIELDGIDLPAIESGKAKTAAEMDLAAYMVHFGLRAGRQKVEHPYKRYSITGTAYRKRVKLSVLPGIGYDIYACHPMFHGGAIGRAAGRDFGRLVGSVEELDGGVYLSVGSAIMSPQVFEKAFSLANNVRYGNGRGFLSDHAITVVDLQDGGGWDWSKGEPPAEHPAYYLRFCKSFYRMGGRLDYICADNRAVLGGLVAVLRDTK